MLSAIRQMEMAEQAEPTLAHDTDVLFKVDAVGVCGSDVHYYRTGRIGSQVVDFPFPVGHECSGTVVEVGTAVSRLQRGDRIALDPALSCGTCDQCKKDRRHTCRHLLFMGCPGQLDGCLSEYCVMPEVCCFKVSPDTSPELVALVEPLSIGCYALQLAQIAPGMKVGILGMGPIGLSVMVAARARGLEQVYIADPLAYRRELALAQGARAGCAPDEIEAGGWALDVVFECCGEQRALAAAGPLLTPGGKLVIIVIPGADQVYFDPHVLRRREITVHNVRRQNNCMRKALDIVENSALDLRFMHTHSFALADVQKAFDLVDEYRDGVIKAIVYP